MHPRHKSAVTWIPAGGSGPNDEFGIRFNGAYRDGNTPIDHLDQSSGSALGRWITEASGSASPPTSSMPARISMAPISVSACCPDSQCRTRPMPTATSPSLGSMQTTPQARCRPRRVRRHRPDHALRRVRALRDRRVLRHPEPDDRQRGRRFRRDHKRPFRAYSRPRRSISAPGRRLRPGRSTTRSWCRRPDSRATAISGPN